MAISKNDSKEQIERLVENFDNRIGELKTNIYNETKTRRDFIDPFLFTLGWDIDNKLNLSEIYREVIHEDKLKMEDTSRAPDYCLTIGGNKKFFIEAKKPSVNLKDSTSAAYQLRRYGWNAKMPISIITDFEEFSIYDCQVKPNADDKATIARINYITYKDYIKEFDFLWETFSKESVNNGSLEKYFQSTKGKRASTSVDDEFLKSLDSWRDLLATDLVKNNPTIKEDELNFSIQKIIDRLIFLRIGEDRNIEDENQLLKSVGINTYTNLKKLFHLADRKYNSGLFDYIKDKITDSLVINDKVLKNIIEEMYYPKSPYEFSVIPVEILGHSYEQYLGKTISINSNHKIIIEEKPEVRKAGGVYYTPQYIVDYIVQNTVGKLVEGKKPEDVAKLKICDPACGSGSFLLGAYQYLLNWHREYYNNYFSNLSHENSSHSTHGLTRGMTASSQATPSFSLGQKKMLAQKEKFLKPDGNLTTSLKKEILLNNIFGVDIDTNAVEVTKLSLMLKAMEGETKASIDYQLSAFHDRVLPTLDKNIKSGNSLIDMDFYESQIDFEPAAEKKIKPFSWEQAFPEVFKDRIIEDNLQAIHVTWATHNSRISERMIRTHVKVGEPVWLTNEMRSLVLESLEDKIIELELRVLALNVLGDHVHLLIVCNPDNLEEIIRKLKGYSSFNVCRELKLSVAGEGRLNKLWGSGFSDTKIRDEHHLSEAITYIENNHIKHGIEKCNRRLQPSAGEVISSELGRELKLSVAQDHRNSQLQLAAEEQPNHRNIQLQLAAEGIQRSAITSIADAFKPKVIKGGFDAVIGNPPYVQPIILDTQSQKFLEKKYEANTDLYSMFIEKQFDLMKNNHLLGFIVPSLFIKGVRYENLRNVINRNCTETFIKEYGDGVFSKVQMPTCIILLKKGINSNQLDHFRNINSKIFNKIDIIKLQEITIIRRGLEIGRDKISKSGKIKCLNGGCIDQYNIKEYLFISETTLKDFNKNFDIFSSPKVIVRETGNKFFATIDLDNVLTNRSLYNVRLVDLKYSPFYILGIINSKLFKFYFKQFIAPETNIFPKIRIAQLNELPIPQNPALETQNQIIKLVETMLQLNKDLQTATLPEQKEQIQQRIIYTDKKIDQLVYQLYDLTEEEIKVVEGNN